MNANMFKGLVGVGMLALSAIGVADIFERREMNRKIGVSMKEVKEASEKEISAIMLEKAVQNAANEMTNTFMQTLKTDIVREARIKLEDEAHKAVKEASDQIQKDVSETISKEASLIDMTNLKKMARDKAEAKILEKFDGNLEDLLSKFNDNLSNVQRIYGGIADAISKTNESSKGLKFTIG